MIRWKMNVGRLFENQMEQIKHLWRSWIYMYFVHSINTFTILSLLFEKSPFRIVSRVSMYDYNYVCAFVFACLHTDHLYIICLREDPCTVHMCNIRLKILDKTVTMQDTSHYDVCKQCIRSRRNTT